MSTKEASNEPTRYVAYARAGTGDAIEAEAAIDRQVRAIDTLIDAFGGVLVSTFVDAKGYGESYRDRFGLEQAIATVEEGEADALVCYDITRIARDVTLYRSTLKRLEAAGGRLLVCEGSAL